MNTFFLSFLGRFFVTVTFPPKEHQTTSEGTRSHHTKIEVLLDSTRKKTRMFSPFTVHGTAAYKKVLPLAHNVTYAKVEKPGFR